MRYLSLCLLALMSFAAVSAQTAEPDGTLLGPNLVLPHNLLPLPVVGGQNRLVPTAQAKAAPKPVSAAKPAPKPAQGKAVAAKPPAKPVAPSSSARTSSPARPAPSSRSLASFFLRSTAYNSHVNQTDRTPFITATGARTRFGVIALSRDMLRQIPYGSLVRIEDMGSWGSGRGRGRYSRMLSGVLFQVEDTMHPRKVRTVDVWMYSRAQAIQWGARQVKLTMVRRGR